jgi:hypothetical protein
MAYDGSHTGPAQNKPDTSHTHALEICQGLDSILIRGQKWLTECLCTHQSCSSVASLTGFPKRVLSLRSSQESNDQIEIKNIGEAKYDYCALSYCWGEDTENFGRTTKFNIEERAVGFKATALPKTILDSIILCKRIGICYLWIDSLCIIQDDPEDWQVESSKMHQIYSNAVFTLAATSSCHANEGLFKPRFLANDKSWWPSKPYSIGLSPFCRIEDPWIYADQEISVALKTRMASRAWTLQEDIMSTRKLYWTQYGILWSCLTHERKEWSDLKDQAPTSNGAYMSRGQAQCPNFVQRRYAAFVQRDSSLFIARRAWADALTQYLPRKISRSEDRLAAIGGLVQVLKPQLRDDYFAGLWLQTLPEDLLWTLSGSLSGDGAQRPLSWSWASLPAHCTASAWLGYSESHNIRSSCIVQNIVIEPSNSVIFGPICSGCLQIRTKKRALPPRTERKYEPAMPPGPSFDCVNHYIAMREDVQSASDRIECLFILDLFGREFCLLVEPIDQCSTVPLFRRVGIAEIISKLAPTSMPLLHSSGFGDGGRPGSTELREFPTDSYFKNCHEEVVEMI